MQINLQYVIKMSAFSIRTHILGIMHSCVNMFNVLLCV